MILRRVIAHFRKQEWTAIAIDFVIVVLGVFVGLQVSNWNDARADRGVVAGHLSEISEDLRSHLELHDALYGSALARIAAVDYIYDQAFQRRLPQQLVLSTESWVAPPTPPIPEDHLDNLMGYVDLVRITVSSRKAYESLINSGHMGMIENRELARDIQLYYGSYDDLLDTNDVFRGFRNTGVVAGFEYGVSVFDERPAAEIIALARRDERFAAYLRTQREWAIIHANLLADLRDDTVALLERVEAERARIS
ncbi:MAG: hypothetical protein H7124_01040 [Phycisphaerales bacterium]|nr:hypothetical protein [Hyphomonadaceae bacterium]